MEFDKDLQSIQEVRNLVMHAVAAQKELAKMSQEQIDHICCEIAQACVAQGCRWQKWLSRKRALVSGRIK